MLVSKVGAENYPSRTKVWCAISNSNSLDPSLGPACGIHRQLSLAHMSDAPEITDCGTHILSHINTAGAPHMCARDNWRGAHTLGHQEGAHSRLPLAHKHGASVVAIYYWRIMTVHQGQSRVGCWGFSANNKKKIPTQPRVAQIYLGVML
jgi:hypothetical protein